MLYCLPICFNNYVAFVSVSLKLLVFFSIFRCSKMISFEYDFWVVEISKTHLKVAMSKNKKEYRFSFEKSQNFVKSGLKELENTCFGCKRSENYFSYHSVSSSWSEMIPIFILFYRMKICQIVRFLDIVYNFSKIRCSTLWVFRVWRSKLHIDI